MSLSNNFLAVRPTLLLDFASTRRLDPRITFTRATTATYYDGVTTALAEQNLLLYSQEFNQTSNWLPVALTVTANTTVAPDGTTTADTFTAQAGSNRHYLNAAGAPAVTAGTTLTFTVFARAGTNSFMQIYSENSLADRYANFDLTLGTVTQSGASTTATITSAGGGWWRCRITYTAIATANGNMAIDMIPTGTSGRGGTWTAVGTETIIVWGAQYEQRATPTAYTATTTAVIANYIPVLVTAPANTARFDHDPVTGQSLGLLIEEPRTNLALYSADFSNANWTKASVTVTTNTIVAPNGTITGATLTDTLDGAASVHTIQNTISFTSGTAYTYSMYAKQGTLAGCQILFPSAAFTSNITARFRLDLGTVAATDAGVTATITNVGNGWYRCSATATATATASAVFQFRTATTTTAFYQGTGFGTIFAWGAQVEAGGTATSYIPTVAGTVPRNADSVVMTGTNFSSWFNPNEGVIYAEIISGIVNGGRVFQAIQSTNTGNEIRLRAVSAMQLQITIDSVAGVSIFPNYFPTNFAGTFAAAYRVNDFAIVGGSDSGSLNVASSGGLPTGMDTLYIGSFTGTSTFVNGSIAKIAYYDTRLTNAQMQALTSS